MGRLLRGIELTQTPKPEKLNPQPKLGGGEDHVRVPLLNMPNVLLSRFSGCGLHALTMSLCAAPGGGKFQGPLLLNPARRTRWDFMPTFGKSIKMPHGRPVHVVFHFCGLEVLFGGREAARPPVFF